MHVGQKLKPASVRPADPGNPLRQMRREGIGTKFRFFPDKIRDLFVLSSVDRAGAVNEGSSLLEITPRIFQDLFLKGYGT